ncbi:MAG: ribulose-phosphate 3-epimerase [bacterium]
MKLLAPSILSADFLHLAEQIKSLEKGKADLIHCDIMDGQFVPNITFGPMIVKKLKTVTNIPLDVHLMINEPENFIDEFIDAGASFISVHYEGNNHVDRLINKIKDKNVKAGIVINPATPVSSLMEIINIVDFVLLMSVNPGFGGQLFIEYTKNKIVELAVLRNKFGKNFFIELDGGVTGKNIKELSDLGVDVFVAGSSVFNTPDIVKTIIDFKNILGKD